MHGDAFKGLNSTFGHRVDDSDEYNQVKWGKAPCTDFQDKFSLDSKITASLMAWECLWLMSLFRSLFNQPSLHINAHIHL